MDQILRRVLVVMNSNNYAVIGAGYGDEGKGLITDYLVRKLKDQNPLVVRSNGGAQAGHTVQVNGHRHVFSHFGAGALAGARTYLSSNFIVNPIFYLKEFELLKDYNPVVWASPQAKVTTVWDMVHNQLQEISRKVAKHGSCGMGINSTVTRHQDREVTFYLNDILSQDRILNRLKEVQDYYAPILERFDHLPEYKSMMDMIDTGREAAIIAEFANKIKIDSFNFVRENSPVIFEGAQGLGLDELLGEYPYVTRSITGLPSAIHAASEIGQVFDITPVYVTRCYATRHGQGPLLHEDSDLMDWSTIVDLTNKPNPWQDSLRFAPFDLKVLLNNVGKDWERSQAMAAVHRIKINAPQLAVTCLDQVEHIAMYQNRHSDPFVFLKKQEFIQYLQQAFSVKYTSYGPEASNVIEL